MEQWREEQHWKRVSKLFGISSAIIMQNTPEKHKNKATKAIRGIWEDKKEESTKMAYEFTPEEIKRNEEEAARIARKLK